MLAERPVLRYFGGKWKIAPWIISLPAHLAKTEGEKFVGLAHLNANGNKGDKRVRFESRARLKAYIAGFNRALELSLEPHESGEEES